jgi:two-component system cell cycle sensor histidine kinase/response regulator CckA
VDRAQLRQLLTNLASNAAESMTGRGTITVRTAPRPVTREDRARWARTGTLLPEGAYTAIEVEDDGCGMNEDVLARAFDPFYSTKFVGRGLGLAMALGVARAHRGGIDAQSQPGRGTKVTLLLPAGTAAAMGAQPRPASIPLSGTILLVEDEPDILSFAEYVLRTSGFTVLSAVDGPGAIETYRRQREVVRLVLLDFSMPRMSGAETFDRLREIDPRVRVLLTSGYSTQDATAGFAPGVLAGFLHKPYDSEVLVAKVRECLG